MINQGLESGVVGQALKKDLFQVSTVNPRDWSVGIHKSVDDRPYGGGDGMVMLPEILDKALSDTLNADPVAGGKRRIIYLSPQGKTLNETRVNELLEYDHLVLISGRYAGVDQRVLNKWIDEEVSIGDYVLSGGELPALVLIDAIARKIPGVLGHELSSCADSFAKDQLLEEPQFTRPHEWNSQSVPQVLVSGNHQKIREWKKNLAMIVTLKKRPELLKSLAPEDLVDLRDFYNSMSEDDKKSCGIAESTIFINSIKNY